MGLGLLTAMVLGCGVGAAPPADPTVPGSGAFLAVIPLSFSFGNVPVGMSTARDVTLSNTGTADVHISRVSVTGSGFSATGLPVPLTLGPGKSRTLTVGFAPPATGTFAGDVTVESDATDVLIIAPTGTGVTGGSPPAASIDSVTVNPATVVAVQTVQMTAAVAATGTIDKSVTWAVAAGSPGSIDAATGVYTAPSTAGTYTVVATSVADPIKKGSGTVTVTAAQPASVQWYVATNGNDANPGTEALPWRTIQNAMRLATPGSTVNIKGGTYPERLTLQTSGTAGSYITFQPYGFSGAPACGAFTGVACGGDQVVIDLTSFGNPSTDGVPFLSISGQSYVRIQGLTFQNYTVQGAMQRGVNIAGTSNHIEINHNRFLHNRNIGPYDGHNALLHFWVSPPASDVVIRGNEFGDVVSNYGETLTTASTNVTIEANWIHDVDNIAINVGHQVGASSGIVVRGNLLEWIGRKRDGTLWYGKTSNAVYVNGGNNVLIERNTVRQSGFPYSVCSEPGYPASHDVVIRNNVAYLTYAGVMLGNWYSNTDGTSVYNVKVLNNTLYSTDNGFVIRPYTSGSVVWKSNAVVSPKPVVNALGWPVGTMDYNLYSGGTAGPDVHKVTADPQFTNAGAANFALGPGSPARDAGDPAASTADVGTLDFADVLRIGNGRIDIGAYESY